MQVVWHDSPGASSQHQARTVSNLGRPAAAPRGAAVGGGAQELSAIKQRLISAAQKPRDVRRPGPPLPGAGRLQQSEQFLEGLLARQQQQQPDVAALAGAAPPPPAEHSNHSGAHSDLAVAGGGSGGGAHRTPATHLRGILKRRGGGSGGRGRQTPASSVKFSLNQSSGKRARHRGGAGAPHAGSSGKKRQAGQKRKALLDLLEQVESIVSSGPSPRSGDEGQGGQQTPGGARLAAPAPPADDPGAVSDKENSADAAPAGRPCSSQEQAGGGAAAPPAHAGPTGSQQLMPPPGGVRCCGGQQAVATSSHHGQQPPQQVPEPAAAAAVAGPQRAQQRPLATAQVGQTQGSGGSGGSGGFAGDDDEEDALMARLELELLTQVEQRQAAARHGWPAQPERSAPAAKGAPLCGAYAQPAPARLQAAPPAAQHPAAAVQQQRQQQQRRQAAAAAQPRPLPRSPYDKALKAQALTAQALPKGAPAAPGTAPGAAPAAAVCTAALQGSDSSWDDDGFDAHLLDQFEAAALKERAGRSGQGQPSAGGSDGAGGTAAAEDGSRPPTAAAAAAAAYPGDRAEVRYRVQEVFSDSVEQVLLLHNKYQVSEAAAEQSSGRGAAAGMGLLQRSAGCARQCACPAVEVSWHACCAALHGGLCRSGTCMPTCAHPGPTCRTAWATRVRQAARQGNRPLAPLCVLGHCARSLHPLVPMPATAAAPSAQRALAHVASRCHARVRAPPAHPHPVRLLPPRPLQSTCWLSWTSLRATTTACSAWSKACSSCTQTCCCRVRGRRLAGMAAARCRVPGLTALAVRDAA